MGFGKGSIRVPTAEAHARMSIHKNIVESNVMTYTGVHFS